MQFDIGRLLMYLLSFIIAVTLHEFAHAFAADCLGDDTPRRQGRVTINPLDHLDPIGTVVLLATSLYGLGFGWGRPVQTDVSRYKNARLDDALVSLAGPFANLLQAIVLAIIIRTGYFHLPFGSPYFLLINIAFMVNIVLFLFNLIPLPPLDGSHIMIDILPIDMAKRYQAAMAQVGWILFIIVVYFGASWIAPLTDTMQELLIGSRILL